ncbi:MAG: 1-deoxy-D-xylulose-5-phosphate reductoisomerase [Synergistaceae bacterium]|jgi:1-deoxy-D-xylulose-5-phosphate reductoisomerase|nr:1-deoxy-D-xylulose-5-phosphate reductoisomerase [Synergistaceae bacterium]
MASARRRVVVIGATGSVGGSVLDICERFSDRFEVTAMAAKSNADSLLALSKKFGARYACLADPTSETAARFAEEGVELVSGLAGLAWLTEMPEADHVVFASSGTDAIVALQRALEADKDVSLANKESIVAAGPWVMPLVRRPDQLRPVDSEHNAIWQCLRSEPGAESRVSGITLTASGGPFREWTVDRMQNATPEDALAHPVWPMGPKITVDSASLMNKGIECIEAMRLFSQPHNRVGAVIHPKSLVHGFVAFKDASVKMIFSRPDMRLPAASALAWPDRLHLDGYEEFSTPPITDWRLDFQEIDAERFPCFGTAMEAGRLGGAYPPLLIGADEVAVEAFLGSRIPFLTISNIIELVLQSYSGSSPSSLEDALSLIGEGARLAREICLAIGG